MLSAHTTIHHTLVSLPFSVVSRCFLYYPLLHCFFHQWQNFTKIYVPLSPNQTFLSTPLPPPHCCARCSIRRGVVSLLIRLHGRYYFFRSSVSLPPCLDSESRGFTEIWKKPFLKNKKIKIFNKAFLCIYPAN